MQREGPQKRLGASRRMFLGSVNMSILFSHRIVKINYAGKQFLRASTP